MAGNRRQRPLLSSYRKRPLPSSYRKRPLPYDLTAVLRNPQFVILVEIDWQSGTEYYSFQEERTPTRTYLPLVQSISRISRESPPIGGEPRIADVRIVLKDESRRFTRKKAGEPFHEREVRILAGDPSYGLSRLNRLYVGKIDKPKFNARFLTITCKDIAFERFRFRLGDTVKNLTTNVFPFLPAGTESHMVPIVYGDCGLDPANLALSTTHEGGGPVPCYRIDPAMGQSKYRYVVAQHVCLSVDRVFIYGIETSTTNYAITTATYDGVIMTVIDFNSDPIVSGREAELEVTAAVRGIQDASVGMLENPVEVLKDLMNTYFSTPNSDLDTPLWDSAISDARRNTQSFGEGYKVAFALVDRRLRYTDIIQKLCESCLISFFVTKQSTFGVYIRAAGQTITTSLTLTDKIEVIRGSFDLELNSHPTLAATLQYNYMYNWVKDYFERQPDYAIPGEAAKHTVVDRENINLWYVRDIDTAEEVVAQYGDLFRENTDYTTVEVTPDLFRAAELNRWADVTHFLGIPVYDLSAGADDAGFVNVDMRIVAMEIEPTPSKTRVRLRMIRTPGLT